MMFAPLKTVATLSLALSALFALGACGPKTDKSGTTITPAPMTTPSPSPSGTSGGATTPMPPASAPASK